MSYRNDLCQQRVALKAVDLALTPASIGVESDHAAQLIARARAMVRGAEQLLAAALRDNLDASVDASVASPAALLAGAIEPTGAAH